MSDLCSSILSLVEVNVCNTKSTVLPSDNMADWITYTQYCVLEKSLYQTVSSCIFVVMKFNKTEMFHDV